MHKICITEYVINTLRPIQNGRHFTNDNFNGFFSKEKDRILIKISLILVLRVQLTINQHRLDNGLEVGWTGGDELMCQQWIRYGFNAVRQNPIILNDFAHNRRPKRDMTSAGFNNVTRRMYRITFEPKNRVQWSSDGTKPQFSLQAPCRLCNHYIDWMHRHEATPQLLKCQTEILLRKNIL